MPDNRPVECPQGFSPEIIAAFDRLVSEHWDERIHLPQDRLLFVLAAIHLARIEECNRLIDRDGLMVPATRRGALKTHPAFGIQLAASREYRHVLEMLGCTAASRKRLGLKTAPNPLRGLPGIGGYVTRVNEQRAKPTEVQR